jgi:arylsulfatase A-like enzyme
MQIPLVMRWPGVIPEHVSVREPVSLVDIVPTLLELVGLPARPAIDGMSVVPLLRDRSKRLERPAVLAIHPAGPSLERHVVARARDRKCLLAGSGSDRCFDLEGDPAEQRPLAPSASEDLAALHAAADAKRSLAFSFFDAPPANGAGSEPADDRVERKLKALGYLD